MGNYIQDFLGNIIFFAAAWLIAFKTPKRELFWLRTALCFIAFCGCRYLYFSVILPHLPLPFMFGSQIGFIVLLGLLAASIIISFQCNFQMALFCASMSYCWQHLCERMYEMISRQWLSGAEEIFHILLFSGIILVGCALLYLILRKLRIREIIINNTYLFLISLFVIATSIVLDIWMLVAIFKKDYGDVYNCSQIYSMVAIGVIMILQFTILENKKAEIERDAIKELLNESQEQYLFEKTIIDMVNVKCHDLKHLITAMDDKAKEQLNTEINPIIEAYDSSFKTENTALDVVLTHKNFDCKKKEIELTCAVDGKKLNFMSEIDIYTLFGNILDNAIEATEKLEDQEKRVISLFVEQKDFFIRIHVENYFSGKLFFVDGLPKTTKKNTDLHGYGMKSIQMLVERYGGNVKIGTRDNRFMIDIMFPI